MDTTEKLLRIPERDEKDTSFLYVSPSEIRPEEKEEWIAWVRKLVKSEDPDFIFSSKALNDDLGCEIITVDEEPMFFDKGQVHYLILPDNKTEKVCSTVADEISSSTKKLLFINVELHAKVDALACVYDGKDDYSVEENGILYMSNAATPYGGIRRVTVDINGKVSSEMFYFADKKEVYFKNNWKTALESRCGDGKILVDGHCLYLGTVADGSPKNCGVYKLDGKGGIIWKCPTENSVNGDVVSYGDKLMAVDCEGRAYFICKDCGKVLNSIKLSFEGRFARVSVASSCNIAYVNLNGKMIAVDIESESEIWENTDLADDLETKAPDIVGNVLVCGNEKGLFGLCLESGKMMWTNPKVTSFAKGPRALPLVGSGMLIPSGDTVYVLNRETGEIAGGWKIEGICLDVPSQPLLRGNTVYLGTKGSGVISIDVSNTLRGGEAFEITAGEMIGSYLGEKGLSVVSDVIYLDRSSMVFTADNGYMYMVNSKHQSVIKAMPTLSAIKTSAAYVRKARPGRTAMEPFLVVSCLSGKIYGVRI